MIRYFVRYVKFWIELLSVVLTRDIMMCARTSVFAVGRTRRIFCRLVRSVLSGRLCSDAAATLLRCLIRNGEKNRTTGGLYTTTRAANVIAVARPRSSLLSPRGHSRQRRRRRRRARSSRQRPKPAESSSFPIRRPVTGGVTGQGRHRHHHFCA